MRGLWSPDSTMVARVNCCVGAGVLQVYSVPSGDEIRVPIGDATALAWSPDSRRLAFINLSPDGGLGVGLVSRDGTDLKEVTSLAPDDTARIERIQWLDGETLAYLERRWTSQDEHIDRYFAVDIPSDEVVELETIEPPNPLDPRILFGHVSPDGEWVAFEEGGLRVWNRQSQWVEVVAPAALTGIWSPDSAYLLVVREDGPQFPAWQLLDVMSGETSDVVDKVGLYAHWLADGRIIHAGFACAAEDGSTTGGTVGPRDVVILDPVKGTGETITITPDSIEYDVTVSPQGDRAAWIAPGGDGSRSLALYDVSSGLTEVALRTPAGTSEGTDVYDEYWSPDGRYLFFFFGGGHGICD